MTHANIQKAKQLIADVMCMSSKHGTYYVSISFFGQNEYLMIDILKNGESPVYPFKTYRFFMDDEGFEAKADIALREIDALAREVGYESL